MKPNAVATEQEQRTLLTVYVVDDDPAIRDALSLSLSLSGYRTAQFASAEDFFSAFDPAWIGCVVADIRMPGMSGLQLQTLLAERGSKLPVVIITGHGDVASARTAFRGKAIDFLEKPFDGKHLISAIETAFKRELGRINQQTSHERREAVLSTKHRVVILWSPIVSNPMATTAVAASVIRPLFHTCGASQ